MDLFIFVSITAMSLKCNNSSFTSESDNHPRLVVTMIRYDRGERSAFSIFLSINVLLIVLGIIVNLAICFVMLRKNRYRRNTSNLFILHLSVTELVYRLLIFPVVIYIAFQTSAVSSVHCKLISFISVTCSSAILVSLVAIAMDRYQHIVHPLSSFKSKNKTFFRVSLVWLYASIISIPYAMSVESISNSKIPETQGTQCTNCTVRKLCDIPQNVIGQLSVILYFLLAFALPVAALGLLYSKIVVSLRRRRNNGMMHKVAARSKCKAVRMLIVTVSGYVLSICPAVVFAILRSFGILNNASLKVILLANELVGFATYTSSLGNPLIYGYYNKDFRRELSRLFCRRKDTNVRKQTTTFNRCNRNTAE